MEGIRENSSASDTCSIGLETHAASTVILCLQLDYRACLFNGAFFYEEAPHVRGT